MGEELDRVAVGRREWIAEGLRYGALVGISLFAAAMLVRRAAKPGDPDCRVAIGCQRCPASAGCRRREG